MDATPSEAALVVGSVLSILGIAVYVRKLDADEVLTRKAAEAKAQKDGDDDASDPTSTRKAPFHLPTTMSNILALVSTVVMVVLLVVLSIGLWHFIWVNLLASKRQVSEMSAASNTGITRQLHLGVMWAGTLGWVQLSVWCWFGAAVVASAKVLSDHTEAQRNSRTHEVLKIVIDRDKDKSVRPPSPAELSAVDTLIGHGDTAFSQGEYKIARQCFDFAIVLDPKNIVLSRKRADVHVAQGDFESCKVVAKLALRIGCTHIDQLMGAAKGKGKDTDTDADAAALQEAQRKVADLHDVLARMFRNKGNYPLAHEHFVEAAEFAQASGSKARAKAFRESANSIKELEFGMEELVMQAHKDREEDDDEDDADARDGGGKSKGKSSKGKSKPRVQNSAKAK